jgi:hypothetical protein
MEFIMSEQAQIQIQIPVADVDQVIGLLGEIPTKYNVIAIIQYLEGKKREALNPAPVAESEAKPDLKVAKDGESK